MNDLARRDAERDTDRDRAPAAGRDEYRDDASATERDTDRDSERDGADLRVSRSPVAVPARRETATASRESVAEPDRGDAAMLAPQPRHATRPSRVGARVARAWAWVRAWDDWREVAMLRTVLPLILVAVSAYYLTIWGHENGLPWGLAWTVPVALDLTAWAAVRVALHPRTRWARVQAIGVAWLCVLASAAGNVGAHMLELGLFRANPWSIALTVSVFPICLLLGMTTTGGMLPRPLNADQQAARDLADARSREERLTVEARGKAERRRLDVDSRPAPAPAAEPASAGEGSAEDTGPLPVTPPAAKGRVSNIRDAKGSGAAQKERIEQHFRDEVAEGRWPKPADVDRMFGTTNYARNIRAGMIRRGELPPADPASATA